MQIIGSRLLGRRTLIVLAILVIAGLALPLILRLLAWPLVAASSNTTADYFCINGDVFGADGHEPFAAAADWKAQSAGGKILLLLPRASRPLEIGALPSFEETCQAELRKRGLPPADVLPTHADAGDLWGMTHALQGWLRARPESTVSIACSPFSSGRLHYAFNKVLDPGEARRVRLAILPDPEFRVENWWRSRQGVKEFMYTWLGLIYAWAEGDISRPDLPDAKHFQEEIRAKIGEAPP